MTQQIIYTLTVGILTSLFTFGVYKTTREGMIFGRLGAFITARFGEFYSKPLVNCPPCMASVWGTAAYFIFLGSFNAVDIGYWIIFVFCLAGWNHLVLNYMPCCE